MTSEAFEVHLISLRTFVEAGIATEQCASCTHEQQFHEDEDRHLHTMCTVCWEFCVYTPAFVPKRV